MLRDGFLESIQSREREDDFTRYDTMHRFRILELEERPLSSWTTILNQSSMSLRQHQGIFNQLTASVGWHERDVALSDKQTRSKSENSV